MAVVPFLTSGEAVAAATAPALAYVAQRLLDNSGLSVKYNGVRLTHPAAQRRALASQPAPVRVSTPPFDPFYAGTPDDFPPATAREQVVERNPGPTRTAPMTKLTKKLAKAQLVKAMLATRDQNGGVGKSSGLRQAALSQAAQLMSAGQSHQLQMQSKQRGIAPDMGAALSKRLEKKDKDGNPVVYGSDYLVAAVATDPATGGNNKQGGILLQYNLNPQQIVTASLAQYAQLYQKFEFLRVGVEFASSEAFTYGGSVNALWDSDIGDVDGAGLQLVQQAATTQYAHECPILRSTIWWYNTKREASGEYYVEEDLTSTAGSRQSIQGHCKVFFVNPISFPGAATYPLTFGSLIVHYVVRFYHRQLDILQTVSGSGLGLYRSNISDNTNWFGNGAVQNVAFGSYLTVAASANTNTPLVPGANATQAFAFSVSGIFMVTAMWRWQTIAAAAKDNILTASINLTGAAAVVGDSGGVALSNITTFKASDSAAIGGVAAAIIVRVPVLPSGIVATLAATTGNITLTTGAAAGIRQFEVFVTPVDISGGVGIRPLRRQWMHVQALRDSTTDESVLTKQPLQYRPMLHETILRQYAGVVKPPQGGSKKDECVACGHEPAQPTECGCCALKYCQEKSAGSAPVRVGPDQKGDPEFTVVDGFIGTPSRTAATAATSGGWFSARAVSSNVKVPTPR